MIQAEEIIIRQAKEGDCAEIANVHLNSWRKACKGLLPQEFLNQLALTFKRRMNMWKFSNFNKKYSFLIIIFFAILSSELFARAGGGSSGGGGGSLGRALGLRQHTGGSSLIGANLTLILLPIIFGFFFVSDKYIQYKITKRKKFINKILLKISLIEPEWSEENLIKITKKRFEEIQKQWGDHNLSELKDSLSKNLFIDWQEKIQVQKAKGEVNTLHSIEYQDVFIVDVKNYSDDNLDTFTTCFDISAVDQTVVNNIPTNNYLANFREFWTFQRDNTNWILTDVSQTEGWKRFVDGHIVFEKS
ncbi:MAG: TIM44-like domain-containing protein [Bacteriovoracaceae bacterium]|nr:TIM44-like domain-containing protein [Bacteriovoracaceae bacterium]